MLMAFIGIQAQDLAAGQMWWGNYSNQQTSLTGNSKLGSYEVAMFVAGDGDLKGVEIAGARMQTRLYSNAKDVKIWVRSSLDGENLVEKTVENPASSGWCGAKFDAPISLPESGAYVGYSFTLASWYSDYDYTPVVRGSKVVTGGLYLKQPDETTFSDKSASGCATTQIIVSGSNLKTNVASIADDMDDIVALKGSTVKVNATVTSQGTAGVSNLDYTYTLDGASHEGHIDLETPFGQMYGEQKTFEIELGAPTQLGTQECEIQITKVNGQPNENTSVRKTKASVNITVLAESAPRTAVAEIYVGPSKYYSGRALVGAEQLAKTMGDKVIPVVVQSYDSPLVIPEYKAYQQYADGKLRFTSYPVAEINREFTTDPYFGSSTAKPYHFTANTIVEPTLNAVTEGSVSATASWADDAKTTVKISAKANFTGNFSDAAYRFGFMVIADSIKQDFSNYITYYKGDYPDDDMEFWRNSPYSSKDIAVNNMVVASTEVNGISKSIPSTITAGTDYTYELELPLTQFEGQNPQNFRVVALLLNNDKKIVVNAALASLEEETTDEVPYGTYAAPVALEDGNTYGLNANVTGGKFNYYTFESAEDVKITLATTPGTNPGGGFGVSTGGFMLNDNGEDLSGYVMLGEDDLTIEMVPVGGEEGGEGGDDNFGVGFGNFTISTYWNAKAGVKYYIMCQGVGTFNVALSEPDMTEKVGTMTNPINLNETPTWTWGVDGKVPGSTTYYTYTAEKDGNLTISNCNEDIYVGEDGWYDPFTNTGGPQYTGDIEKTTDWAAYTATHTFAVEEGVTYCITIFDLTKGNDGEVIKAEFTEAAPAGDDTAGGIIFKWANVTGAADYVAEAGTIECLGGDKNDRLNYKNTALGVDYMTISLNGKKGNLGDGTTNGTYMKVTPSQALKAGDVIAMTAFRNKDAMGKKASAALIFDNGASAVMGANPEFPNLNAAGENPTGAPETIELTVTEEMAGATSINLTRNDASTNLFITSLIITSAGAEAVVPVESVSIVDADNTILDGATFICEAGETLQVAAVITPENATNKNVTWEVLQDTEVVTFEDGLITAVAPGKAAVVVTTEDGEKQAFVSIFVAEKDPVKEPATFEISNEGLDVTITPSNDNVYSYAVSTPEIDAIFEQMYDAPLSDTDKFVVLANSFNIKATGETTFNVVEDYLSFLGIEELEPGTNIQVVVAEVKEVELDGETMLIPDGELFTHEFTYGEGADDADNVEWDPAPGEINFNAQGGHLDQVILTFTDAGMVELNEIPFKANIEDAEGNEVDFMYGVNFYFLGMNQACITFNKGVKADGTYTVNVPAGLFTLTMADGTTKPSTELHATYIVTGAGDAPVAGDKLQIIPAEGNVTSLQQFTLVSDGMDTQLDVYGDLQGKAKFYKDGVFVEEVAFDYDPEDWFDTNLYGSLSAPVTEDGTYTLEFPVGIMTTDCWMTSNTEPVVYTWTIGEGGEVALPYGTYAEPIALEEGKTYGMNMMETNTPNYYVFQSDVDVKIILTPSVGTLADGGGIGVSTGNFYYDPENNDLECEPVETEGILVEDDNAGIGGDDEFGDDFGFGMGRIATAWTAQAGVKYYIMAMGQGSFTVSFEEPEDPSEWVGTMENPINLNEHPTWTWGEDGKMHGSATYYTFTAEKDGQLSVSNAVMGIYVGEGGWFDPFVNTSGPEYTGEITEEVDWAAYKAVYTFAVEAGVTYCITMFDIDNDAVITAEFAEATGIKGAAANKANGNVYNVRGQKVDGSTFRGIMIKNGVKILKK